MAKTFVEISSDLKAKVDETLESVRKALNESNLAEYNDGMAKLKKIVSEYNASLCNVDYAALLEAENPMIAAVKQFYVEVAKITEKRDDETDAVIGVDIEKKKARIDLEKFCEFGRLDKTWAHDAESLRDLLELRETEVFGMKPEELSKKSFYFINAATRKKSGETPDSNTQIVALLQKIIDEAIFVDNGEGKNVYKCNNHDIVFIRDAVTKFNAKEKCSIQMLNARQFKTVMMSVFAHCLGEKFSVKTAGRKKND
jgi:hypothetical protein